jgi:hypothetical protein
MHKSLEQRARRRADQTAEHAEETAAAFHDLRNALNALVFRLHMLERAELPSGSRTQLEAAVALLRRSISLVGRLEPPPGA